MSLDEGIAAANVLYEKRCLVQAACSHEPVWVDAGPYSDDICYRVCKKCDLDMTPGVARKVAE